MIYLNLNIRNPWWMDRFESIQTWYGKTFIKNKSWEVHIVKIEHLFRIEFQLTTRQDHAGLSLELALFGYQIGFTIYDERHWDYDRQAWMAYEHEWGGDLG